MIGDKKLQALIEAAVSTQRTANKNVGKANNKIIAALGLYNDPVCDLNDMVYELAFDGKKLSVKALKKAVAEARQLELACP